MTIYRTRKDDLDFLNDLLTNAKIDIILYYNPEGKICLKDYEGCVRLRNEIKIMKFILLECCLEINCYNNKQKEKFNSICEKYNIPKFIEIDYTTSEMEVDI